MQANVNLDALLEKMKAELERAKGFEPFKLDKTVKNCLDNAYKVVKERERLLEEIKRKEKDVSRYRKQRNEADPNSHIGWLYLIIGGFILLLFTWGTPWMFLSINIMLLGIADGWDRRNKVREAEKTIEELEKRKRELEIKYYHFEELAEKVFNSNASLEECRKKFREYSQENNTDWKILSALAPQLEQALIALSEGDFITAKGEFKKAEGTLKTIANIYTPFEKYEICEILHFKQNDIPCIVQESKVEIGSKRVPHGLSALNFASNVCHVLHYGDMEEARKLLEDAQERLRRMRERKWGYSCGNLKFFQYLFEFHYFLLKAVVEAYEAEVGAVARATEEQAERFAAAKPVEVPETVEKVTVSAEEPEKELYRGEVRFKMGAMSQERVGTLVITKSG